MSGATDIRDWPERIRQRYENYLKTSFFFKEPLLRASFQEALREEGSLLKGPFPEPHRRFADGMHAHKLAAECFPGGAEELVTRADRWPACTRIRNAPSAPRMSTA